MRPNFVNLVVKPVMVGYFFLLLLPTSAAAQKPIEFSSTLPSLDAMVAKVASGPLLAEDSMFFLSARALTLLPPSIRMADILSPKSLAALSIPTKSKAQAGAQPPLENQTASTIIPANVIKVARFGDSNAAVVPSELTPPTAPSEEFAQERGDHAVSTLERETTAPASAMKVARFAGKGPVEIHPEPSMPISPVEEIAELQGEDLSVETTNEAIITPDTMKVARFASKGRVEMRAEPITPVHQLEEVSQDQDDPKSTEVAKETTIPADPTIVARFGGASDTGRVYSDSVAPMVPPEESLQEQEEIASVEGVNESDIPASVMRVAPVVAKSEVGQTMHSSYGMYLSEEAPATDIEVAAIEPPVHLNDISPSAGEIWRREEGANNMAPTADEAGYSESGLNDIAPAAGDVWRGGTGQTLREVLSVWSHKAGAELRWKTEYDYPLQAPFVFSGDYTDAVRALLSGFSIASPQPIGTLHLQGNMGGRVLVIKARGNSYRE